MTNVRLYIDEDVSDALGRVLRARAFDAIAVSEVGRLSLADPEQLQYAIVEKRAILTYNVGDYSKLAKQLALKEQPHYGIIVSDQLPFGELMRRVLNLLHQRTAEEMFNRFDWLPDYR